MQKARRDSQKGQLDTFLGMSPEPGQQNAQNKVSNQFQMITQKQDIQGQLESYVAQDQHF